MSRVHMPANGGFFTPTWFKEGMEKAKRQFDSGEISQEEYDEEVRFHRDELYLRNLEFRQGRG